MKEKTDEEKREEARGFIPSSAWEIHQRISALEERVSNLETLVLKLTETIDKQNGQ